jgi:hypothetical protein
MAVAQWRRLGRLMTAGPVLDGPSWSGGFRSVIRDLLLLERLEGISERSICTLTRGKCQPRDSPGERGPFPQNLEMAGAAKGRPLRTDYTSRLTAPDDPSHSVIAKEMSGFVSGLCLALRCPKAWTTRSRTRFGRVLNVPLYSVFALCLFLLSPPAPKSFLPFERGRRNVLVCSASGRSRVHRFRQARKPDPERSSLIPIEPAPCPRHTGRGQRSRMRRTSTFS